MIIQAELKCKQTGCEAEPCAVDKAIALPSPRFKQFSRALLMDYDFIAENKSAIRHDGDAWHCLLILDAGGTDGFLVDPQGYNYARYSAFVPNARSLLTPDMAIDRSYLSPIEPWRDESRNEMLRMTLRVDGKPNYTLVLPADEKYLDAVKAYLDIDVFADAMLCDIRFKVPYIGELVRDTDCPAVEDYNDFAEALEDIWQKDGVHKRIPVAEIELDDATGFIQRIGRVCAPEHLPVGISVRNGIADHAAFNDWWRDRSIPASRSGVREALEALGVTDTKMLLIRCYGLSLSDQYWICPEGTELRWEDINFFQNDFSEDIGDVLFGERRKKNALNFGSPDSTAAGNLKKRWKIIDGKRCLIKGGSNPFRQQPFNEVIASAFLMYRIRSSGAGAHLTRSVKTLLRRILN